MAKSASKSTSANLGFEATLWQAADKQRGHMDAAEYKHVVLGLIFLKYISDAFEEQHAKLAKEKGADPEDRDEYLAVNIFWVPPEARWTYLQSRAKDPVIGKLLDSAMVAIERDNASLKGVLPKEYARQALDKRLLGELVDLISTIGLGDETSRTKDVLGRVYEYFLSQFASAEGKKGGQFYTPRCVVQLLVEMLAPYKGRVFDPCCGSGGMFVQSVEFVKAHATGNGNGVPRRRDKGGISIFGQESNPTTWKLAMMNLAIRGIDADLGKENADSFHRDLHKDLKADYILANPPFNMSDWGGDRLRDDVRWKYGAPPVGNANFAWVQHFIHHLAPTGIAGFVLANGSMSSNTGGEGDIRKAIIEADLVDCMVALPGQLFYSTQIPVCLWFIARDKRRRAPSTPTLLPAGEGRRDERRSTSSEIKATLLPAGEGRRDEGAAHFRDRRGQVLFIDARRLGTLIDRVHRELTEADLAKIAGTYHLWRGYPLPNPLPVGEGKGVKLDSKPSDEINHPSPLPMGEGVRRTGEGRVSLYQDIPGFCKSATLAEIRAHGHVLTPGRYVGAEEVEDDGEPFDQKMKRLTATLEKQFTDSARLENTIRRNLAALDLPTKTKV